MELCSRATKMRVDNLGLRGIGSGSCEPSHVNILTLICLQSKFITKAYFSITLFNAASLSIFTSIGYISVTYLGLALQGPAF